MAALSFFFFNFEVNNNENFRTKGTVNIFCFALVDFKTSLSERNSTSLEVCFQDGYFKI